jgi:signal transduction histidine kinase
MGRARQNATPLGVVSTGFISAVGVALLVPNALRVLNWGGPIPALVLAAVGVLLSVALIAIGYLLLRDETTATHAPRIAGWAALGTVLLGLILVLISLSGVDLPVFAGATLLSVSTFAHVLIGVRDVQRIRAEELARQREKLAVLNRLVRHNLRHEAQYLLGIEGEILDADGSESREELSDRVRAIADRLSETHDTLKRTQSIISGDARTDRSIDLKETVGSIVSEYRSTFPEATFVVDVPEDTRVSAGPELRTVIEELIDNAVVHTDGHPEIRVTATAANRRVRLTVADDGTGIPEPDRSVLTREAEIDQLTHAQGLGLWFVRWAMDAYGGGFELDTDEDGTAVTLEFSSA